jgi:hypothetical protein
VAELCPLPSVCCQPPTRNYPSVFATNNSTEIITAYESLHAAHVVHGDTGVQRIRRAADGTLRLVGFENAWAVDPAKPREMADVHDEYRCVLREYGFDVPEELSELVPPWEMEEEE